MSLYEIFGQNVLLGLSVCASLVTITWCIALLRLRHARQERFLVGFIGLLSVYQAMRISQDIGIWKAAVNPLLASMATLVVTLIFLVALLVVHLFGSELWCTRMQLRVAEANQVLPPRMIAAVAGETQQTIATGGTAAANPSAA
jgi:uncharacterized membrane protein